jgi:hemolysin activation/secretion protein
MRSFSVSAKRSSSRIIRLIDHLPRAFILALACAGIVCAIVPKIAAADSAAAKPVPKEIAYSVSFFAPVFESRPGQANADAALQANWTSIIGDTEVDLGQSKDAYIAPTGDVPIAHPRISDLNVAGSALYSRGAILAIDQAIVRSLNAVGYGAVLVVPSPNDIDPQDLSDMRPHRSGTLHLLISIPTAAVVRTVSSGNRFGLSQSRVNNSKDERIIHNSPIQANSQPNDQTTPFFNEQVVNDYADRLNRQPGRRVDVALSAADAPDQYTLDYLVNETKPWYVYAQLSNTGPATTETWRERFGVVDNQLTGNDDILNVDAVTDFEESTNLTASYEFPLVPNDPDLGTDRLRARVYGIWDQYAAADLGFPGDNFTGSDYSGGAELIFNVYQAHSLFVDVIGGARFQHSSVKSTFQETASSADYVVPYAGARVEDNRQTYNYSVAMNVEGGITSADASTLSQMGRADPDKDFILAQPNAQGSFYLEPLVDAGDFDAGRSTLAHEIYLSLRGQWAFNYRVIPQFEQTAGGFYTVRGYPEAETAGDNVFVATAEYRFHLPRALGIQPNPTNFKVFGDPFRLLPQQPYQRPDWDLIFRGFIDAGQVLQSSIVSGESNDTLVGAGVGAELQVYQNIDIRGDWAMALTNLTDRVSTGSSRFTLVLTLLY